MKNVFKVFAIALLTIACVSVTRAQVNTTARCLTPPATKYLAANCVYYSGPRANSCGAYLDGFSSCDPLPPGFTGVVTFTANYHTTLSRGGGPFVPVMGPANVTVHVTYAGNSGGVDLYQTEMLQLDIQGGTFPAGTMIR